MFWFSGCLVLHLLPNGWFFHTDCGGAADKVWISGLGDCVAASFSGCLFFVQVLGGRVFVTFGCATRGQQVPTLRRLGLRVCSRVLAMGSKAICCVLRNAALGRAGTCCPRAASPKGSLKMRGHIPALPIRLPPVPWHDKPTRLRAGSCAARWRGGSWQWRGRRQAGGWGF